MIIQGTHNTATVFTDNIDKASISQIQTLCNQEYVKGQKIRIMPDVHAGKGCTIGFTMTYTDKLSPNLVGVDISCGMNVTKFTTRKSKPIDFQKVDNVICTYIPSGQNIRKEVYVSIDPYFDERIHELKCFDKIDTRRAMLSIGTLGSGNHFIEIDKSENDYYLVIHSGSRNLGLQVASYYQKIAHELHPEVPFEMAYLEGDYLNDYLHDMLIMADYAEINRLFMSEIICDKMKFEVENIFETVHNYVDLNDKIIRKGAVSAQKNEILIIPINMRDGSLICKGKGNPDWNYSAPHGAGRKYSRTEAKNNISMTEFKMEMIYVWTTSVSKNTIDEAPDAYKPIGSIINNIVDTVDIIDIIKPVYNFKA